jgi:phosphoglucosamine mutase
VLHELGARVTRLAVEPDGLNINLACGATHVEPLCRRVVESGADLGIALDGDADRLIMVDHAGEVVDGDRLLWILAVDRLRRGVLHGGVVGTLMSNLGLEQALEGRGVPFARARVGDRYVLEQLYARGWQLGGESSGHLICLDRTTTGDGIVAALQVLAVMVEQQRSLHDLKQGMESYPMQMRNVRVVNGATPLADPAVTAAVAAVERELGSDGRVLLRTSGTEPVVRVMVEGRDARLVTRLVGQLAEAVRTAAGS